MRVIRMELGAKLRSDDENVNFVTNELGSILFQQLEAMDLEITDVIRQRASSYLPATYSVFVRTHLEPEGAAATTELWIVDPTIRWPFGLLTRSAWKILAPLLAHVVRESFESRLQNVSLDVDPKNVKVIALTPTRTWRDPVLLSIIMVVLTSLYWVYVHDWIKETALLP